MKRIFGSIFEVRKGEIGITLLMFANYYLILVTYYLLKPARDSLFLVKVSPELLPLVFVITALVTAPVVTSNISTQEMTEHLRISYLLIHI